MHLKQKVPWSFKEAISLLVLVAILTNVITYGFSYWMGTDSLYQLFLVTSSVQTFLTLAGIYIILRWKYRFSFREIGLHTIKFWPNVFFGIGYGLLLFLIVVLAGLVIQTFITTIPQEQFFARLVLETQSFYRLLILVVIGVLLAPLGEELLFRGFIYRAIQKHTSLFWANLLSSILFAALHFDPFRFIPLTLGGMGLAWVYESTGSLFSSIAAHGVWNAIMMGFLILANM